MSPEADRQLIWQRDELTQAFRKLEGLGAFTIQDRGVGLLNKRLLVGGIPIVAGLVYYSPEFFYRNGSEQPIVPFPRNTHIRYDVGKGGKIKILETPLELVFYPEEPVRLPDLESEATFYYRVNFQNGYETVGSVIFDEDGDISDQKSFGENKGSLIVPNNPDLLVPTWVSGRVVY